MTSDNENKESLKHRINLARAIGLLTGAKQVLELGYETD